MRIEQATEATEELVDAIERLLPQLTEARTPPTLEQLARRRRRPDAAASPATTTARIVGTLTLVSYRVSSGLKGRIEDVIVDESARGPGRRRGARARGHGARERGAAC